MGFSVEKINPVKNIEKINLRFSLAKHLARAKGSTLAATIGAPILIVINKGIEKIFDPLCILTVLLGLGLCFICGWISKKLAPEIY